MNDTSFPCPTCSGLLRACPDTVRFAGGHVAEVDIVECAGPVAGHKTCFLTLHADTDTLARGLAKEASGREGCFLVGVYPQIGHCIVCIPGGDRC